MSVTTPRPNSRPDRALAHLRVIVNSLQRSARAIERGTGVTNAQLFLLQSLQRDGPLTINALAQRARTDQSTASIVVQRLVGAGLVKKVRDRVDRRRVLVSLTPRAHRKLAHAPVPPTAALIHALERLSTADAAALDRGLAALHRALHPPAVSPGMLFEAMRRDIGEKPRRR